MFRIPTAASECMQAFARNARNESSIVGFAHVLPCRNVVFSSNGVPA